MSPKHSMRSGIRNMGTAVRPPAAGRLSVETGDGRLRGGASVVVRGRESRPHGKGGQEVDTLSMTEKSVDADARADKAWLLSVQRKLYQWSREHPEERAQDPYEVG